MWYGFVILFCLVAFFGCRVVLGNNIRWKEWCKIYFLYEVPAKEYIDDINAEKGVGVVNSIRHSLSVKVVDNGIQIFNWNKISKPLVLLPFDEIALIKIRQIVVSGSKKLIAEVIFAEGVKHAVSLIIPWRVQFNKSLPASVGINNEQ